MIPSVTHHKVHTSLARRATSSEIHFDESFEALSFSEKLKKIGLIDEKYNLLFPASHIPDISEEGQKRFSTLMQKKVYGCNAQGEILVTMDEQEYITGFQASLAEKGISSRTYLRGSTAAYVADLDEYFEFLIHKFLASRNLPMDLFAKELEMLKKQKEVEPDDVDLFDEILTKGIPSTALCNYHTEFFCQKNKIQFIQLLLPKETTKLFPYPTDYMLVTVGNPKEKFQTDRIIGKLHHPYLFTRDDIRIEIKQNHMCIPESSGNFWQMVIDRKLKIVRTEPRHELDFRTGLAAHQLIQDHHILIEDNCPLQSILNYALSIGDEKVFTGAADRAKLHCKTPLGFLLSILIAYTHTAKLLNLTIPENHLKILSDEIEPLLPNGAEKVPSLPCLYKYALLLTLYRGQPGTYAEWDPSGLLILDWAGTRIVFPKQFAITSKEKPFFAPQIRSWTKAHSQVPDLVYNILDGELSPLERVLFVLSVQHSLMPLIEALVDYLLTRNDEPIPFMHLLPKEFCNADKRSNNMGWITILLKYSLNHGIMLWNASKTKMADPTRHQFFEELILQIIHERPNQATAWIDQESIPKELRLKLLKKLIKNPHLSIHTSVEIIEELIKEKAITLDLVASLIRVIESLSLKEGYLLWKKLDHSISTKLMHLGDRFPILQEHEAWFFQSDPSKERIEALSDNTELLLKWIDWKAVHDEGTAAAVFQKYKNIFKKTPEIYIKYVRQFLLEPLAKEWIGDFPTSEGMDQALLFFAGYTPKERPLLTIICSLPGLHERKLIEALYLKGHLGISCEMIPFFQDRRWVKSQYKVDAEVKTKEWGDALINQGNLKEVELMAVEAILARTTLKSTPLLILKNHLESLYNEKLTNEDSVREYYHKIVAKFHKSVQIETDERLQHFFMLFELLDLGVAAQFHSISIFNLIEEILAYVPIVIYDRNIIDPLFNLLQTLSLVDYGSEELHNEWHIKKYHTYRKWIEATVDDSDLQIKNIEGIKPLVIVPYSSLQVFLKYAHLFKLTTEQFIEDKMTTDEFHSEVRERITEMSQFLIDEKLMSHEDPCLVCIHDLTYFLKNENTRVRAYEAFYYLLNQRKNTKGADSNAIDRQCEYLKVRKSVENFIISKNKGIYTNFLSNLREYFKTLSQNPVLHELPLHNPILDALELDSLHPLNKLEVLLLWINRLEGTESELYNYHILRATSLSAFEKSKLKEEDSFKFLTHRLERLKTTKHASLTDKETEAILIFRTASIYLSKKKAHEIRELVEKALDRKLPVKFLKIDPPINLPIKAYLGSHGCDNVADDTLLDSYLASINSFVDLIEEENLPYYPLNTVLKLVKLGLLSGFAPSDCLTFVGMIANKAFDCILESENKVIHDPYMNLLQSLSLFDFGPNQAYKENFLQAWIIKLESTEKPHLISYANEIKSLKFPSHERLVLARNYIDKFKMTIRHFVGKEITGEEFLDGINVLTSSAAKNFPANTISRYTDPCTNAISELSYLLADHNSRMRAHTAFSYVFGLWTKSLKQSPTHINDLQNYLVFRRSTEDVIMDRIDFLNKNQIIYFDFFLDITNHIVSLYGSYIPDNVHILDPVLDALEFSIASPIIRIELLKLWILLLRGSSTPTGKHQADVIENCIHFLIKKIQKSDIETFMGDRFQKLRNAQNSDAFESEKENFLTTAAQYISPQESESLNKNILTMLKITNTSKK